MSEIKAKSKRIWELDFLRGFAILMVVFDHFMVDLDMFRYDFEYFGMDGFARAGGVAHEYLYGGLREYWWPVFVFAFFFTSGLCTAFSKNHWTRALKIGGVAAGVSWFTYVFSLVSGSDLFILFGVLHCFSLILLLYALVDTVVTLITKLSYKLAKKPYNQRVAELVLAAVCLVLSIVSVIIHNKYNTSISANEYVKTDSELLGMLFYVRSWHTADYFPLFPFVGFFFFGASLAKIIYKNKKSLMPDIDGKWHLPFTVAGRYSLLIYLLAQVVSFGIIALAVFIETGSFMF